MFHVPLLHVKFSNGMGLYKNGMLVEVEIFVFKKPNGILHSTRPSLYTLENQRRPLLVLCVYMV